MFASHNYNQAKQPEGRKPERGDSKLDNKTLSEQNPFWQSLAMRSATLQPKLTIGQADDPYEREADRVADQVMRMPVPQSDGHGLSITLLTSRQAQRKCVECEEEEGKLQRKESGGAEVPATAPPIIDQALSSPGQPLDEATRAYFEPRFGSDFSEVRVHTDAQAAESARAVNALAYTTGRDVLFGTGRYEPRTRDGMRLLAHELTHVAQQSRSDKVPHGYGNEQRSWSPISLRNAPNRVYRQPTPAPLDMTTEAQVALVFDRLATASNVQVATEVNIAVQDEVGNWIFGRIDRIVRLPDGSIKGIELKLDATSSKTPAQTRYIPLANGGSIIEITGHAADQLNLPQGTRIRLRILIVSSENVGQAMEMLGIKSESLPRVIRRPAGSRPPPQPPAFESAPESAEQVPRSPKAVRLTSETPPPGVAAGSGTAPATSGRRVPAYSATPEGSNAVRESVTAAGEAMPASSKPPGGPTVGSPGKELQEPATTRPLEPAVPSAPREQQPPGAQSGAKPAGSGANQGAAGRSLSVNAGAAVGVGGAMVVETAANEWVNYLTNQEIEKAQQAIDALNPDISREMEKNHEMGAIILVSFSEPWPGYPREFLGASYTMVSGLTLADAQEAYSRHIEMFADPVCPEIITRNYKWVPPKNSTETEAYWSRPDICDTPWADAFMQWWGQLWERLKPGMFRGE